MTGKEAYLHELKESIKGAGFQCHPETYEAAIAALEKQIPKEPDYQGDGYSDGALVIDTWICPNCGEHYEIECDRYRYCPNCGQCIDHNQEVEG